MKPLNRAERNSAFLSFLLLFFITIGIMIAAVFFSVDVPFRQNEQLRKQMLVLQVDRALADSFNVAMQEAMNELAKFDLKKETAPVTNQRVQFKITKMKRLIENIPDGANSVYALMIQNVADLNEAKTRIRNLEEERNYAQHQ